MERAPPLVLDSSIAVKWFSKEIDSHKVLDLLNRFQASEITLCVMDFLFIEVANALRYKPSSDPVFLNNAIGLMYDLKLVSYPHSTEILQRASEISFDAEVSLYDAIPVALAEQLDTYCITADRRTQYNKLSIKQYPVKMLE